MGQNKPINLGKIVITAGVHALNIDIKHYLDRLATGDYGDNVHGVSAEDMAQDNAVNDQAAATGKGAIYAWYQTSVGIIQMVTYIGDSTTVMLPEEY